MTFAGLEETGKSGWWKLSHNFTPRQYVELSEYTLVIEIFRFIINIFLGAQQRKRRDNSDCNETVLKPLTKRLKIESIPETKATGIEIESSHFSNRNFAMETELKIKSESEESSVESENENVGEILSPCKPSLFSNSLQRELPWKICVPIKSELDEKVQTTKTLMNQSDETEIYRKLKTIIENETSQSAKMIPAWIRRYYRKLHVRYQKRKMGNQKIFDIDNVSSSSSDQAKSEPPSILDRFCQIVSTANSKENSFQSRLIGSSTHELTQFESPFSSRILHPFIFRDTKCLPPWIKVRFFNLQTP